MSCTSLSLPQAEAARRAQVSAHKERLEVIAAQERLKRDMLTRSGGTGFGRDVRVVAPGMPHTACVVRFVGATGGVDVMPLVSWLCFQTLFPSSPPRRLGQAGSQHADLVKTVAQVG